MKLICVMTIILGVSPPRVNDLPLAPTVQTPGKRLSPTQFAWYR